MTNKNSQDLDNELENNDLILVTDEEGNQHECMIIDIVEYKNKNYASLVPANIFEDSESNEEEIDTADLFIMEIESTDEGDILKSIENDPYYEEICQMMIDRLSEDFDIEY
ncbi:MAG: DUF1292 domain-containing protein [Oscillospiraceae bacterium]|nr:DUF1292 domain-containing protein [Oscillospiraceae bacterium]